MALEKLKIRLLEKTDENDTSSGQSSKILSNREMKIQNFEKLKTEIEKLDLKNANCYDPNESVKLRGILMGKMGKPPFQHIDIVKVIHVISSYAIYFILTNLQSHLRYTI